MLNHVGKRFFIAAVKTGAEIPNILQFCFMGELDSTATDLVTNGCTFIHFKQFNSLMDPYEANCSYSGDNLPACVIFLTQKRKIIK